MQRQAEQETPSACVRRLLQDIEYEAWLLEVCKNRRQAERRMENIQELIDWMNRLQEKWDDEPSLSALLAHFSLVGMLERRDEDAGGDCVQLLTLHSAKGLEFDHVFIAGVEEGILPHRNSLDADNIEEERRLTYVGITRARRSLTLTYASQRRVGGEDVDTEPSRFLLELPADHLQWDKPGAPIDNQTRLARGASQLANLKQMLARE
jgi:ATP-dependent DNA helicase Rep